MTNETSYSDEHERTKIIPDIVIRKGQKRLLVLDAKYKDSSDHEEINRIWIYCIALSLTKGILVYPRHIISEDETRTPRTQS